MNKSAKLQLKNSVTVPLTGNLTAEDRSLPQSSDEARVRTEWKTQRALDAAGFGKFNHRILFISGLICVNVTFSITSLGFVMPSAACDYNMDTIDKGRISTSLICGMLCGLVVSGWIADTYGRKRALRDCLFLQAFCEFTAALVSNYWGFVFFKFFSGLAESGLMIIVYPYLGEFQPTKYRKKLLSYMQIPFVIGITLSPVVAWSIIPLDLDLSVSYFSFKSWNLFVVAGAVFSLINACLILPMPETPKYLADSGRDIELRDVLTAMYCENTGNTSEEYLTKLNKAGIFFPAMSNDGSSNEGAENGKPSSQSFRQFLHSIYGEIGGLFKRAYIVRTINLCLVTLFCYSALYSVMFWIPEIFHRFADFEEQQPGKRANLCIVSRAAALLREKNINDTIRNSLATMQPAVRICNSTMDTSVYRNAIMLGVSQIPTTIIFIITVARLGFRFFLVFNCLVCWGVTIGMFFVTSSMQNLIICCLFESLVTIALASIHCLAVELFPTHLRVSASALSAIFGRFGAFLGNTTFGYLIDYHCSLFISIVAIELFLCGALGIFLTNKDDHKVKQPPRYIIVDTEGQKISDHSKQ